MNKLILGLAFGLGIMFVSSPTMAVGCNADEVEVYRDAHKIVCKDREEREEYAACIRNAGEQMKRDLGQNCGRIYKDCFEQNSLNISIATAVCLGTSLAGCGPNKAGCAEVCNVGFTMLEWAAYHSCSVDVTPCYESALASDKERKELCKQ